MMPEQVRRGKSEAHKIPQLSASADRTWRISVDWIFRMLGIGANKNHVEILSGSLISTTTIFVLR